MKTREEINEDLNDVGSSLYATLDPDYTHFFKKWQKKYDKYLDLDIDVVEVESKETPMIFDIIRRGASPRPIKNYIVSEELINKYGWLKISDVTSSNIYLNKTSQYINEEGMKKSVLGEKGDLLITNSMTVGVPIILNIETCFHDGFLYLGFNDRDQKEYDTLYLYYFFLDYRKSLIKASKTGIVNNLNTDIIKEVKVAIPKPYKNYTSYDIQKILVEFLEYNLDLVENYRKKLNNIEVDITIMEDGLVPAIFDRDDDYIKRMFIKWNNNPVEPRDKKDMVDFTLEDIEFDENSFKEVYKIISPSVKINKKEMLEDGNFPVVSQSQNLINGYYNSSNGLIKPTKPLIIFGDHTTILKYIDFDFLAGADGTKILESQENIDSTYIYYSSKNRVVSQGYKRHFSDFKNLSFKIPKPLTTKTKTKTYTSYEVQEAIVSFIDRFYIWKANVEKWIGILRSDLDAIENGYLYKTFKG